MIDKAKCRHFWSNVPLHQQTCIKCGDSKLDLSDQYLDRNYCAALEEERDFLREQAKVTATQKDLRIKIGEAILRELDTGGTDYLQVRRKISELSGIPMMAVTFDEHIKEVKKKIYGGKAKRIESDSGGWDGSGWDAECIHGIHPDQCVTCTPKSCKDALDNIPEQYQISDDEINAVWGNGNFGDFCDQRDVILETLLKYASGYTTGHTATVICQELKLLGRGSRCSGGMNLTKKGKKVMYHWNKAAMEKNNT